VYADNHLNLVNLLTMSKTVLTYSLAGKGRDMHVALILPSRQSDNVEHGCTGYLWIYHKYFPLSIRCSSNYLDPQN